ncbi:hypothetical protein BD414DRAFT_492347 [Trametes punicea]|nr:hypothetical protein BD414DRAFT_492347 [Trametes punicea]
MVFIGNASGSDKDQSRSTLKSRMQSRLQTAFMPQRRHIQSSSAIIPSAPQSECSTLVDFTIEDVAIEEEDNEAVVTENDVLHDDNSAWSNGKHYPVKAFKNRGHIHHQYASGQMSQDELLGTDNSAWVGAAPSSASSRQYKVKLRPWFTTGHRHSEHLVGCEPEMLDVEDRAWM